MGGGVWGLGSCYTSPCAGAPDHIGGFSAAASVGTNRPPSPRGRNYGPSLPILPIYLLLYSRSHGENARSAAAYTPSLVPSPVILSIVICSVCRDLVVFVIVIIITVKISTLHTLYDQLPPPQSKNSLVNCFACKSTSVTELNVSTLMRC